MFVETSQAVDVQRYLFHLSGSQLAGPTSSQMAWLVGKLAGSQPGGQLASGRLASAQPFGSAIRPTGSQLAANWAASLMADKPPVGRAAFWLEADEGNLFHSHPLTKRSAVSIY